MLEHSWTRASVSALSKGLSVVRILAHMLLERQTLELPRYDAATTIRVHNIQISLGYWELFYGHIE